MNMTTAADHPGRVFPARSRHITIAAILLVAATVLTPGRSTAQSAMSLPEQAGLPQVDQRLVDGSLRIAGTPSALPVLAAVGEIVAGVEPRVRFTPDLRGPDTAMPHLLFGTSPFVLLDREISRTERVPYRKIHGADPLSIRIARISATPLANRVGLPAIYVNSESSLRSITPPQVARIFAQQQSNGDISDWRQLAGKGSDRSAPITLYGPEPGSELLEYLKTGHFKGRPIVAHLHAVTQEGDRLRRLRADATAMALAQSGLEAAGVRQLPLAPDASPASAAAAAGDPSYPYVRYLYVHIQREARHGIDASSQAFITAALSKAGQAAIGKVPGYVALTEEESKTEISMVSKP